MDYRAIAGYSWSYGGGLAVMENHFCALYGQSVDDKRTDKDSGHSKTMIINDFVYSFSQGNGFAVDDATIKASDLEPGPARENIRS